MVNLRSLTPIALAMPPLVEERGLKEGSERVNPLLFTFGKDKKGVILRILRFLTISLIVFPAVDSPSPGSRIFH